MTTPSNGNGAIRVREEEVSVPLPLENGDRLALAEFERRYHAMPGLKKAELIEGIVYMPSPVQFNRHARPHARMVGWLLQYEDATPGTQTCDNATVRLDPDNETQPDALLRIVRQGASYATEDGYLSGAPELVVEIASSTASYDLHDKREVYRRNGVAEYLVWLTREERFLWWRLEGGAYREIAPDESGVLREAPSTPASGSTPPRCSWATTPRFARRSTPAFEVPSTGRSRRIWGAQRKQASSKTFVVYQAMNPSPRPETLPSDNLEFAWDRPETGVTLRAKLAGDPASPDWLRTAAWLMREARVEQIWPFLSLETISAQFSRIAPLLGRRRPVWDHLLRAAHELGRLGHPEEGSTRMGSITTREAKNHLYRYLAEVEAGASFVVTRRKKPVARLSPVPTEQPTPRPKGGQFVDRRVKIADDALEPLSEEELRKWGV